MKLEVSVLRINNKGKLETIEMKDIDLENSFKDNDYDVIPVYPNEKDGIESELRINYYEEGDER